MPVMRCARCCGENSLPIYSLGVLLALASHLTLLDISDRLAMQIVLSLAGILVMIVVATLLNSISIRHGRQPRWRYPTEQVHKQVGLLGE
jgi:SNF family Na+-dependent transporter